MSDKIKTNKMIEIEIKMAINNKLYHESFIDSNIYNYVMKKLEKLLKLESEKSKNNFYE